jgi:hypothetical protein
MQSVRLVQLIIYPFPQCVDKRALSSQRVQFYAMCRRVGEYMRKFCNEFVHYDIPRSG